MTDNNQAFHTYNTQQSGQQRLFTEAEVYQLFQKFRNEEKATEERNYDEQELPLEISPILEESPRQDLIYNFKRFKKRLPKFYHEEIAIRETLNKNFVQKCKNYKSDTYQIINTIYKISENTRAAARAVTVL